MLCVAELFIKINQWPQRHEDAKKDKEYSYDFHPLERDMSFCILLLCIFVSLRLCGEKKLEQFRYFINKSDHTHP
jgi:hypothetical protein